MTACADCLRRSWLLARLAPALEAARGRSKRLPEVLAVGDAALLAALGGADRPTLDREYEEFDAGAALEACRRAGVESMCRCQPDRYPAGLGDLGDPPAALFVAGTVERLLELLDRDSVAVVGARRASAYGLEVAAGLGRGLAAAGVTVVSGMALGVDSAAHLGALEVSGPTVAVLACAPERAYPSSRRRLHERLRESGAVISELPPGSQARRWSFPARNRIIAALSRATVVVEAGERSGSLITASLAADTGREVAAVPGRVTSPLAAGANALLKDGATLVRDAQDALDLLYGSGVITARAAGEAAPLEPRLEQALEAVRSGGDTAGALASTGLGIEAALAALTELELRGRLRRAPGGRYVPVT
jgi:DNA processing protein